MRCAIESGSRPGQQRWLSDKRCTPSAGKHRVSSGWRAPCGSSSSGEYGYIDCLIPLLLPRRRLRSPRSNPRLVLALATPGANPFSDVLLPPLLLQKRFVQKNETHPFDTPISHLSVHLPLSSCENTGGRAGRLARHPIRLVPCYCNCLISGCSHPNRLASAIRAPVAKKSTVVPKWVMSRPPRATERG